jgi:CDGSH-type Zn-finger protein
MPDLEPADKLAEVVQRCPTGALHFKRLDGGAEEAIPEKNTITIVRDGPLNVLGNIEIYNSRGELEYKDTRLALCRCGKSGNKPLCDGSHNTTNFINLGKIDSEDKRTGNLSSPTFILKITWNSKGPFKIEGPVAIHDSSGEIGFQGEKTLLCGCGKSANKPFCDGSHARMKLFSKK